jgi:hypothetical protein
MNDLAAYPGLGKSIRRVFYALISHLLIVIDYLVSETQFLAEDERRGEFESGVRYGNGGRQKHNEFVALLRKIKAPDNPIFTETVNRIAEEFQSAPNRIRAEILSEYISKQMAPRRLFVLAGVFEQEAFTDDCPPIASLSNELKSFVFILVDYFGFDRRDAAKW